MAKKVYSTGVRKTTSGGGSFMSVKDGESAVFTPLQELDEVTCFDQHSFWDVNPAVLVPCLQEDCPACELGNEPRYRAFLPVALKTGEIKIFAIGLMIVNQLVDIADEIGNIVGKVFKVSRKGSGLSTRYVITALGKTVEVDEYEVPDTVEAIGPQTRNEIAELLRKAGYSVDGSSTPSDAFFDEEVEDEEVVSEEDDDDLDW